MGVDKNRSNLPTTVPLVKSSNQIYPAIESIHLPLPRTPSLGAVVSTTSDFCFSLKPSAKSR
ncbi:unnamed protein product [Ectocarpus sp. CCAP 1310/34]|nr:unnamed protein product [Ectocarpus sp. CCAP 1310/34]